MRYLALIAVVVALLALAACGEDPKVETATPTPLQSSETPTSEPSPTPPSPSPDSAATPSASTTPVPTSEPTSTPTASPAPLSPAADPTPTPTPDAAEELRKDWIAQVEDSGFSRYTYDSALDAEAQSAAEKSATGYLPEYGGYEARCNLFAPDGSYVGKPVRPMGDDEYQSAAFNIWAYTGQGSGWLKWYEFDRWSAGAVRTPEGIVAIILVCVDPEPEPTPTPSPTPLHDPIVAQAGTGDSRSSVNYIITEGTLDKLFGDIYLDMIGPCQTAIDLYDSFDTAAADDAEAYLRAVLDGAANTRGAQIRRVSTFHQPDDGSETADVVAAIRSWIVGDAALTKPCPISWWYVVAGADGAVGFMAGYEADPRDYTRPFGTVAEWEGMRGQQTATEEACPGIAYNEKLSELAYNLSHAPYRKDLAEWQQYIEPHLFGSLSSVNLTLDWLTSDGSTLRDVLNEQVYLTLIGGGCPDSYFSSVVLSDTVLLTWGYDGPTDPPTIVINCHQITHSGELAQFKADNPQHWQTGAGEWCAVREVSQRDLDQAACNAGDAAACARFRSG